MVLVEDGPYIDNGSTSGINIDAFSELKSSVSPKIVQQVDEDGDGEFEVRREFEPLVVTRLGGTLPWDTDSVQLQCGETVTAQDGDQNIRLVFKCICRHSEFKTLKKMRGGNGRIKLVSRTYTRFVKFDELKFDRIPDANGAVVRGEGEVNEPFYKVMLQSKEDGEDNSHRQMN
jgi:hypothetical protein